MRGLSRALPVSKPFHLIGIYMFPCKEGKCPGCGLEYGHHNTKVDINSQECSSCVNKFKYKDVKLVSAE